ncbi:F-box protein PP2-B11-like isoform X1 [Salvia hispanica]|uniref:F-box protein PP2-B11-like isoform X1 n=1 Tax=Salvia hispanica TaxID=49212 RepID=UPI002009B295|nr:F-box protein PP2-B11-like isoform X1 [Salvia hispanica]
MQSFWIGARELSITWSEDPQYWNWLHLDSCSGEVAELVRSCWLEIIGKIDTRSLRLKTSYSAYLVFKLQEGCKELQKATASVRFVKEIGEGSADEGYGVFIDTTACDAGERGRFPHCRSDGWMEIKLGEFFNNLGDDGEVEMRLIEKNNPKWKIGLVVRGIDIRPN